MNTFSSERPNRDHCRRRRQSLEWEMDKRKQNRRRKKTERDSTVPSTHVPTDCPQHHRVRALYFLLTKSAACPRRRIVGAQPWVIAATLARMALANIDSLQQLLHCLYPLGRLCDGWGTVLLTVGGHFSDRAGQRAQG